MLVCALIFVNRIRTSMMDDGQFRVRVRVRAVMVNQSVLWNRMAADLVPVLGSCLACNFSLLQINQPPKRKWKNQTLVHLLRL